MSNVALCIVLIFALSCCSVIRTESFTDTHRGEDGQLVLLDTRRNWDLFRENVDFRVNSELAGRRPEGGSDTWQDFWRSFIEVQETGLENQTRYINYVIEVRRAVGLPELSSDT